MWEKLKKDKELQIGFQANIAMAFKDTASLWKSKKGSAELDSSDLHIIANAAANYFVDLLCEQKPFQVVGDGSFALSNQLVHYLEREENYLTGKKKVKND